MPFINNPDSLRDLLIFMISFISSLKIINVVKPDPNWWIFWWIASSVSHAVSVNPNGIKTLLGNSLSSFSIKGNPVLNNGPKYPPKNPADCPIL